MRTGNIFEQIKSKCPPGKFDLKTAEGRADWDDALRETIRKAAGEDEYLFRHAGEMVKYWRRDVLHSVNREIFDSPGHEIFFMADTPEAAE